MVLTLSCFAGVKVNGLSCAQPIARLENLGSGNLKDELRVIRRKRRVMKCILHSNSGYFVNMIKLLLSKFLIQKWNLVC